MQKETQIPPDIWPAIEKSRKITGDFPIQRRGVEMHLHSHFNDTIDTGPELMCIQGKWLEPPSHVEAGALSYDPPNGETKAGTLLECAKGLQAILEELDQRKARGEAVPELFTVTMPDMLPGSDDIVENKACQNLLKNKLGFHKLSSTYWDEFIASRETVKERLNDLRREKARLFERLKKREERLGWLSHENDTPALAAE